MALRPSRYNLYYQHGGEHFLYNTVSNAFIRLGDVENQRLVKRLGHTSALDWIEKEPAVLQPQEEDSLDPILGALVSGQFLVTDEIDELEKLRVSSLMARHSMASLNLTLVVTHHCNFDCPYCYEDRHLAHMPDNVQNQIIRFVNKQREHLKTLSITWFGGEPLVSMRAIRRLSLGMIEIALKHDIKYSADIITNGYRLTRAISQELVDLGVTSAQVTLDGSPEYHDVRRPLASGKGTFHVILDNIEAVCDLLPVSIRVNLDHTNLSSAYRLVDLLAERDLASKVTLNFAPVHSDGKGCADRSNAWGPNGEPLYQVATIDASALGGNLKVSNGGSAFLYRLQNFAHERVQLYSYAFDRGFVYLQIPNSKGNACIADMANGYVVEPDGTLQKCWQTVSNHSEKIGDVFSGAQLTRNHTKWLNFEPFAYDKCKSCRVLPVCMGWCPHKIMQDPSPESCNVVKHTIVDDLRLFYRSQLQERQNSHVAETVE